MQQKLKQVKNWLGLEWRNAYANRDDLQRILLELAGFDDIKSFLHEISPQTAMVTFVAGSASRWRKVLGELTPQERLSRYGVTDIDLPRTLVLVKNLIPHLIPDKPQTPIGIYPLLATRGLGQQIIVYRLDREKIEQEIVKPLGLKPIWFNQQLVNGGLLGHGDALLQMEDLIKKYRYIICNFGSDTTSKRTLALTLLTLFIADKYQLPFSAVLPTAYLENVKYKVKIDEKGIPLSMGHAKLKNSQEGGEGLSNISIFAFNIRGLLPAIEYFKKQYQKLGSYTPINGKNELAVDNLMEYLMKKGQVRQLCIATPGEIECNVKLPQQLAPFISFMHDYILPDNGWYR